jgi:hypothetical protein
VAVSDQLIADIIARIGERQPHTPDDLWAIELELRTKWGGKRSSASKVVRDALERAYLTTVRRANGKRARPI